MSHELLFFAGFIVFIVVMLAIDLGMFSKGDKPVTLKVAAIMSGVWVFFALAFSLVLYIWGNELHNIHDFAALREIISRHYHNIVVNENDLAASIQLYNKTLTIEYLTDTSLNTRYQSTISSLWFSYFPPSVFLRNITIRYSFGESSVLSFYAVYLSLSGQLLSLNSDGFSMCSERFWSIQAS